MLGWVARFCDAAVLFYILTLYVVCTHVNRTLFYCIHTQERVLYTKRCIVVNTISHCCSSTISFVFTKPRLCNNKSFVIERVCHVTAVLRTKTIAQYSVQRWSFQQQYLQFACSFMMLISMYSQRLLFDRHFFKLIPCFFEPNTLISTPSHFSLSYFL